jgi:hypothetical protein
MTNPASLAAAASPGARPLDRAVVLGGARPGTTGAAASWSSRATCGAASIRRRGEAQSRFGA